ncbi:hypothetical protein V6N12_049213 [Hibiscus sabdariffa]|uniref:RNase H type-1 domain-containing protein n=1 Tax=Hibiscus sabdariffa TaxID=183260 RepID=A0ABR2EJJ6_9ROSI
MFITYRGGQNAVADKLVALGHALNQNRSLFATPPGLIVGLVGEEQACWEDLELRRQSILDAIGLCLHDAASSSGY